jgi:hypothetical protein
MATPHNTWGDPPWHGGLHGLPIKKHPEFHEWLYVLLDGKKVDAFRLAQ